LLLLPVRSLTGSYVWATCPHLLERLSRDRQRALDASAYTLPELDPGQVLTGALSSEGRLILEERHFTVIGAPPQDIVEALANLVPHEATRSRLGQQLSVLADDDFAWFARYGLAVQARNTLRDNKTSNGLWYEEALPPDTLLYCLLGDRRGGDAARELAAALFDEHPYLQVGANETVGQGWLAVARVADGEGNDH